MFNKRPLWPFPPSWESVFYLWEKDGWWRWSHSTTICCPWSCISSFPSFYSRIRVDRTGWGWFVLVTFWSLIASGYRLLPDTKETFDLFYFRSISRTDTSQNPDFLVFSITDITVVGSLKGLSYLGSFFLYKPIRHLALLKTYDICGHSLPLLSATYPQGRSPVDEWW